MRTDNRGDVTLHMACVWGRKRKDGKPYKNEHPRYCGLADFAKFAGRGWGWTIGFAYNDGHGNRTIRNNQTGERLPGCSVTWDGPVLVVTRESPSRQVREVWRVTGEAE